MNSKPAKPLPIVDPMMIVTPVVIDGKVRIHKRTASDKERAALLRKMPAFTEDESERKDGGA